MISVRHFTYSRCDLTITTLTVFQGIFTNASYTQGILYTYNYASPSSTPQPLPLIDFLSANSDFHPLGLTYHSPSHTLSVINHAFTGPSLSLFTLHFDSQTSSFFATHKYTVKHRNLHTPNALVHLDADNLLVTNDHFFAVRWHPWLAALETYLALPGGTIVHVHIPSLTVTVLAHVPFANGIEVLKTSEQHKTLAVASTAAAKVVFFDLDISSGRESTTTMSVSLSKKREVHLPFLPDNLGVDDGGALLISGHGHVRSINQFAHSRASCRSLTQSDRDGFTDVKAACEVRSPTFVAQWTDEKGVQVLYASTEFSSGSAAARDVGRGVGIVSGLFEDGLLLWRD